MTATDSQDHIRVVNHHFRRALDHISEGILILEHGPLKPPGPRVVFLNRGIEVITGLTSDEVYGRPIGTLFAEAETREGDTSPFPPMESREVIQTCEIDVKCQNGESKRLLWSTTTIEGPEGQPVNYLISLKEAGSPPPVEAPAPDTGARTGTPPPRETGDELSGAPMSRAAPESTGEPEVRFARESTENSISVIAGGVAHDFRNMLTTIQARLDMALMDCNGDHPGLKPNLEEARKASDEGKRLAERLLDLARGSSPKKQLTDIGVLVMDAVQLGTSGTNVRWNHTIAPDLRHACVDGNQIMNVINNMVINACQATPNGGVLQVTAENVDVEAEMNLDLVPGRYIGIRIRDRGCGIPEDKLDRIFDAFYTTKQKGCGLGLAACYSIVRNHRGLITVQSRENKGTEFRVYLPASAGKIATRPVAEPATPLVRGYGPVLVVDDQVQVRCVAEALLERLGYQVASAENGEDAIALYKARLHEGKPFSAVLMDITLPGGLDGVDTMHELKRIDPSSKTIVTSGYLKKREEEDQYRKMGFVGVLPKPYTAGELSVVLNEAIRENDPAEDETDPPVQSPS